MTLIGIGQPNTVVTGRDRGGPAAAPSRGAAGPALPRPGTAAALGLGTSVLWLSVLVLIPLAAVVVKSASTGWSGLIAAISAPAALEALRLTLGSALLVGAVNAVMGTVIAWVLVRDRFFGKRLLEVVIDIPFALPTIVAGLVMLTLYGPNSAVGIDLLGTRRAVVFVLLFVTLPFVVRSVQPVLEAVDPEVEEAATSLGASGFVTFRRILLPILLPAIASGTALAFARAVGEYGSVLLISGGRHSTRVSSMLAFQQIQNYDYASAAATATTLLVVSVVVLAALDLIQRRMARRA